MESSLLQRIRHDRRKLLDFILSSDLIKQVTSPDESENLTDVDLDNLSADYVLECIKSGGQLNLSEASKKYTNESGYPIMINSPSGSSYFLCSDPVLSGSPPRRVPPKVEPRSTTNCSSSSSNQLDPLVVEEIGNSVGEDWFRYTIETVKPCQLVNDSNVLSLGLPILSTGLSDDDLRETAYELLLGSMVFSGFELHSFEDKKKEKKSRLLSRLRSKIDKIDTQPQTTESHVELLDVVRVQMQISEAMDACIRKKLMQFASKTACGQINAPQISLELVNSICKYDFPSEKSYIQWKRRQTNILEELIYCSSTLTTAERTSIRSSLVIIRNNEKWDVRMSPSERAEVLLSIRRFSSKLSSMTGKFGIPGETYYWTGGYHMNIKLYEKLLSSVFDILDEGELVEESNEILRFVKVSWAVLGITEKMHYLLYGWVLFQQFVETGEAMLLDHAISEMQKVLSNEDDDGKEGAYMNSLVCSFETNGGKASLSLTDAVFLSMSVWCDSKLQDYHLHFSQKPVNFARVLALVRVVGMPAVDDFGQIQLAMHNVGTEMVSSHLKGYIEKSIQVQCLRVMDTLDIKSKAERRHPLALLADELKLIAGRESTVFIPELCHWCPEAGMISSMLLHQFYGERLRPFLDGVSSLSEDARSVLPAADMLDLYLTQLYYSAHCEDQLHSTFGKELDHYQIGEVSRPIILDWVSSQRGHILEWTERAFHLEDWEPLSFQQRQATSIIEVFRIIEEALDQFFGLKLPMDFMHLQSLLSVVSQSLDAYLLKMVNQLVEKTHLFPAAPALTRYKEALIPTMKKKLIDSTFLEEKVHNKLNELTVSKLCVRLNTLQYIQNQIVNLEDGIRKSWALVRQCVDERWTKEQLLGHLNEGLPKCNESIDGLFTTFNRTRKSTADAINRICDFIGARVIFWDMRNSFLSFLYRGNVESARLERSLPHFDNILDQICALTSDTLRDPVVVSICRASLDAYIWVLLDGGPSRVFSHADIHMMQEDLNILKDFFVADGEGLPPAVVEKEAKLAQQILNLYSLQTQTLIEMLMGASEKISIESDCIKPCGRGVEDAHTLLRVLCHKKDREASKFLKRQYNLPKSSEYDDSPLTGSTIRSPLVSDLLKRSTSFHWAVKGQRSFRSIKKKLKEATSEIGLPV